MCSPCERFITFIRAALGRPVVLSIVAAGCAGGLLLQAGIVGQAFGQQDRVGPPVVRPGAAARPAQPAPPGPAAPSVPVDPDNPPKFRCDEPVHTFAQVWSGDRVEHTYVFHNDGTGPLEILNVRPDCGCTPAGEYTKVVPPGGEGRIPIALNTRGMRSEVSKRIRVQTNDPQNQQVILTIQGPVNARIAVDPPAGANWGRITPQSPESMTVKVTNNMPAPMKLEPVTGQPESIFEFTVNEIEPGKVSEVVIRPRRPYQDGQNSARLRFNTGVPEEQEIQIAANLFAPPVLEVVPAAVTARITPTRGHEQVIAVNYNGEGELRILSVETSDSALEAELQERQAGKNYSITLTIPADYATPADKPAALVLRTDSAERPSIEIPVRAQLVLPTVQPETLVGKPAPVVTIKSTDGKDVVVGARDGKVKVLNFWTTWCPHCRRQMPIVQRLGEAFKDKDVEFLNISVGPRQNTPEDVEKAVRAMNLELPVAVDQAITEPGRRVQVQAAASKYGANSFPTLFLVGKDNIIESVHRGSSRQGSVEALEQRLREEIEVLLAGKNRSDFPPLAPPTPGQPAAPTVAAPAPPPQPPAPARQGPALTIDNVAPDLGLQRPDSTVPFNLQYRNDGTEPVSVTAVKVEEGVELDASFTRLLQPGSTGELRVQIQIPDEPGTFSRQVTLESSDPNRPSQVVTLNGTARPYFEFLPPAGVIFARNIRTHAIPGMATLAYHGPGTADYEQPESDSPSFEAYIEPIAGGPYAKLIVKAQPPFEVGENKATLRIRTKHERQPVLEVPVQLYLPPRIEIEPAEVIIPSSPRLQRSVVTIRNNGDTPLSILKVDRSSEKVNWQFYPEPDGLSYKLLLTLPATEANLSPEGERITIHTDDSELPEIVIPIKVAAEAAPEAVSQAPR